MVIQKKHLILASNSPRRRELLGGLGIDFSVNVIPDIEERCPQDTPVELVAQTLAETKAAAYTLTSEDFLITADTIVVVDKKILGKPQSREEAISMLKTISGRKHSVITGVCLTTLEEKSVFSVVTEVTFKQLSDEEIAFYVNNYRPYDKAGAYGIQEWIGFIGVTNLSGSYFNVMGLPVQRIYSDTLFQKYFSL